MREKESWGGVISRQGNSVAQAHTSYTSWTFQVSLNKRSLLRTPGRWFSITWSEGSWFDERQRKIYMKKCFFANVTPFLCFLSPTRLAWPHAKSRKLKRRTFFHDGCLHSVRLNLVKFIELDKKEKWQPCDMCQRKIYVIAPPLMLYTICCAGSTIDHLRAKTSQKKTPELEARELLFCKRCLNNLPSYLSSYRACVIVSAFSALFSFMPFFYFSPFSFSSSMIWFTVR